MGRTDLARFRKNAPSIVPPVDLPPSVTRLVHAIETHSDIRVVQAIRSLSHASSQRDQVSAIKLLGVTLRETRQNGSKELHSLTSREASRSAVSESVDNLIEELLSIIVFDIPEATPALVSTALRAILRCEHPLHAFNFRFHAFFDRLEDMQRLCTAPSSHYSTGNRVDGVLHKELASDVNAVAAVLSETESKSWIFDHPARLDGVTHLLSYLTAMHVSMLDNHVSLLCTNSSETFPSSLNTDSRSENLFFNISLTTAACESSMKVAQDLTSFLSSPLNKCPDTNVQLRESLVCRIFHSCSHLLKLDSIPRSCSLACSVALVTSQILISQKYASKTQLLSTLRSEILSPLPQYPFFSQLSLLRAVLEAPLCKYAFPEILFKSSTFPEGDNNPTSTVFDILATLISESSDLHFRYLATETMISCIRAVAPHKLDEQCRDAIMHLIYLRWEEPFAGTSTQIREMVEALVSVDGHNDDAKCFWLDITANLVNSNWLSKGMYAPLCALVKRVGATEVLKLQPNCQYLAMLAAASDSHLTKAASDWLDKFWAVLYDEYDHSSKTFIQSTASPLLTALLNDDHPILRERIAEHILPLYLKCGGRKEVKKRADAILSYLGTEKFTAAQRVRGTIIIASVARKQGVVYRGLSDQSTVNLIYEGLNSSEGDLRSFAFDLIVSSSSQTEPIEQVELDLVLSYTPSALMPGGSPSDQSKFKHSMRRFFERFAACRRSATEGSGGWWARERKQKYGGERTKELDSIRIALLERLDTFEKRCLEILMGSSYPGASCLRRTSAFEVMSLMSRIVGTNSECSLSKFSISKAVVASFLSALFDDWERPRRAAYDYVSSLPSFLPEVSPLSGAESLQIYANEFLNSPRQSHVDSGASLFRILFQKHVCWHGTRNTNGYEYGPCTIISFPRERPQKLDQKELECEHDTLHPEIDYCMGVFDSIEQRMDLSRKNFLDACNRGLFHGQFLVLRYIFQDFPWSKSRSEFVQTQMGALILRFVDLCDQCLRIALHGVSFRKFNETIASEKEKSDDGGVEDGHDSIFLDDEMQVESTSCFLSAKEICVALGVFCNQVPLSEFSGAEDVPRGMTYSLFTRMGELFCYVFTNTRHWGVIDGATEGMQLLCERVLASSSISLRCLPTTWVSKILSQALNGKLYVLRRSAGIPWLITAAVNAEASVNRKSHDSPLLNTAMSALLNHLKRPDVEYLLKGEDNDEEKDGKQAKVVESAAHVLNFLRSLFLNSNIAGNMLQYTEKAIMHCINAFHTKYWLIRNSAMMLYSALIRRGIGVCKERIGYETVSSFKATGGTSGTLDGERRMTSTTTFQFFSRHPMLIPFLLSHLQQGLQFSESSVSSSHESLYPTLYLISCLSPDTNKDPTLGLSMSALWPVVRKCSHWHVEYVRRAAAAATVSLIEECSAVPSIIQKIMQSGLPSEPLNVSSQSTCLSNQNRKNESVHRLKQNHLHGDLLTLIAILRNVQNLLTAQDKLAIVEICTELLPSRIWISVNKLKNRCSVSRSCMFELLALFYDIARDVWNERKCNASSEVLKICNRAAIKIDLHEIYFEDPKLEVGAPVLRIKAMRFLSQTLLCQCKIGVMTLETALKKLICFVTGYDKESFISAVETSSRLLQLLIESKSRVDLKSSDEMSALLQQLWISVNAVVRRRQNAEKLVVALDLMGCILEVCRVHPQYTVAFENVATETIFDATNDACIDVCERALIVSGQWIERNKLNGASIIPWMRAVMRACASQTPSTRIAGCTSLFKSGFAFASPVGMLKRDEELSVQARMIWTSLLEDDSSEVRRHTLDLANKYAAHETGSEIYVHFLPCLMNTFAHMSTHFPASKVLYNRLAQSLGVFSKHNCEDDGLLSLIAELVGLDDCEGSEIFFYSASTVDDDEFKENGQKQLFRLETKCGDGEAVLHMQLLAWTYARILYHRRELVHQTVDHLSVQHTQSMHRVAEEIHNLRSKELDHLRRTVMHHGSKSQKHGSIYSETLTTNGFAQTMCHVLRVFLVLHCALVHDATSCIDYICGNLQNVIEESCEFIHPVLGHAMSALTKLTKLDELPQQTLFLLPPRSMALNLLDR